MKYSIDFGRWSSIFAVPSEIVDKYIKYADPLHIKVVLWLLRHSGKIFVTKEISDAIGVKEKDVTEALVYWENKNIVTGVCNNKEDININVEKIDSKVNCNNTEAKESLKRHMVRYQRPNTLHVANRIQTSSEINSLMQEAQVILGRPLSNGDSAILLMLHDNDGLPIDVIFMLLQYAVSVGKTGMKYIEKTGFAWACEGIDNLEKAEKKIISLNKIYVLWKRFENIIGIEHRAPTKSEEETILRWFDEWNYSDELIKESYERCVNSNGKYVLKYMDSIIKRWKSQGIVTLEQALAENMNRKKKSQYNQKSADSSYNIEEYEKYNIFDYIKD